MRSALRKVYRFYADGFRSMTVGRTLWLIVLLKLFLLFAVLKPFFFRTEPSGHDRARQRLALLERLVAPAE